MKAWFDGLEARERIFVSAAVVVVVLAVAWFGLWSPLDKSQESAAARVEMWKSSMAELQGMRGRVQIGGPKPQTTNESLVVIIDNTLRQRGLTNSLQRSQPTPGGNGIRVEFENAAFDDLVLWLGDLQRQHALQVISSSFSISAADNKGRVNSSLTLER